MNFDNELGLILARILRGFAQSGLTTQESRDLAALFGSGVDLHHPDTEHSRGTEIVYVVAECDDKGRTIAKLADGVSVELQVTVTANETRVSVAEELKDFQPLFVAEFDPHEARQPLAFRFPAPARPQRTVGSVLAAADASQSAQYCKSGINADCTFVAEMLPGSERTLLLSLYTAADSDDVADVTLELFNSSGRPIDVDGCDLRVDITPEHRSHVKLLKALPRHHQKLAKLMVKGDQKPVLTEIELLIPKDMSSVASIELQANFIRTVREAVPFSVDSSGTLSARRPGGNLVFSVNNPHQRGVLLAISQRERAALMLEKFRQERSKSDCEDVLSETVCRAFRCIAEGRLSSLIGCDELDVKKYLFAIRRNVRADGGRAKRRSPDAAQEDDRSSLDSQIDIVQRADVVNRNEFVADLRKMAIRYGLKSETELSHHLIGLVKRLVVTHDDDWRIRLVECILFDASVRTITDAANLLDAKRGTVGAAISRMIELFDNLPTNQKVRDSEDGTA